MNEASPDLSTAEPSQTETIRRNYKNSANNQIFDMARGIFNRARTESEPGNESVIGWNGDPILLR